MLMWKAYQKLADRLVNLTKGKLVICLRNSDIVHKERRRAEERRKEESGTIGDFGTFRGIVTRKRKTKITGGR